MKLDRLDECLIGGTDPTAITLGFLGAFRRSELVGLRVNDIQFVPEGLLITLRRSKTDRDGEGRKVAIPHGQHKESDAGRALQTWLSDAGITEGPVYREVRPNACTGRSSRTRSSPCS